MFRAPRNTAEPYDDLNDDERAFRVAIRRRGRNRRHMQNLRNARRPLYEIVPEIPRGSLPRVANLFANRVLEGEVGDVGGFTPGPRMNNGHFLHPRHHALTMRPSTENPSRFAVLPSTRFTGNVTGYGLGRGGRGLRDINIPIVFVTSRISPGRDTRRTQFSDYNGIDLVTSIIQRSYGEALQRSGVTLQNQSSHYVQISYGLPSLGGRLTYTRLVPVARAAQELYEMLRRDAGYVPEGTNIANLTASRDMFFQFHIDPLAGSFNRDPFAFDPDKMSRRLIFTRDEWTQNNNLCVFISLILATKRRNRITKNDRGALQVEWEVEETNFDLTNHGVVAGLIEEARELRTACRIANAEVGKAGLQRIADHLNITIHVIQREAADGEIYKILPSYVANNHDLIVEQKHVYIYFVNHHCHAIRKPHMFVNNEDGTSKAHLMCDFCLSSFKDKKNLLIHFLKCSKNPTQTADLTELIKMKGLKLNCDDFAPLRENMFSQFYYCLNCRQDCGIKGCERYRSCRFIKRHEVVNRNMFCTHCGERGIHEGEITKHQCYCDKKIRKPVDPTTVYFWDIESMFDADLEEIEPYKTIEKNDRVWEMKKQFHIVNCVVLMNHDGTRTWDFNTIEEFCEFIFSEEEEERFKKSIFYAHNGGGYDNHFINKWLLNRGRRPYLLPSNDSSPTRLICLEYKGRKFCDSLNFIAQPLSTFGKAFDLDIEKGYFPYLFNTVQNQGYEGPMPDKKYFGMETVKCGSKEEFNRKQQDFNDWYDEECLKYTEDNPWKLRDKLFHYCRLDVNVLRQGIFKFREMCLNLDDGVLDSEWNVQTIDPFNYLTLSGIVISIALSGFTTKKQFAQFPYKPMEKQQGWVNAYKEYLTRQEGYEVLDFDENQVIMNHNKQYAKYLMVRPEDKDRPDKEARAIWWIHANCYNVGCEACFPENRAVHTNPFMKETMQDLDMMFRSYLNTLKEERDVMVTFDHELSEKPTDQIYNPMLMYSPIDPREALFGGRTEAFKLYSQGPIYHIDVVSLYPTVCAYDEIPIGIPRTITDPALIMQMLHDRTLFGCVRCSVKPPKNLLIPFLPHRREGDGRLVFSLEPMTGTWTTVDLYFAMDQGYEITNTYRATHFEEDQRRVGPFKKYIDTFIRIKKRAKIDGNKTLYLIAKLFLNSLWGKFVEKPHRSNLSVVVSAREYYQMMASPHIDIETMRWMQTDDNVWMVRYDVKEQFQEHAKNYNAYIGIFVLAHARRRLHTQMVNIGLPRVCYCDTDSIAFNVDTENPENNPQTGDDLGEWDNEVEGWEEGNFIKEFVGVGPKSYSETYEKPEYEGKDFLLKFKGVSLTYNTIELLNPQSLKKLVFDYSQFKDDNRGIGVPSWTINNRYTSSVGRHFEVPRGNHGGDGGDGGDERKSDVEDDLEREERQVVETFSLFNMKFCKVNLTKRELPILLNAQDRENVTEIQTFPIGWDWGDQTSEEKYKQTYKIF